MNSINFFYDQKTHTLDKFMVWALTWGRTIVMITELIALSAFLYRFGLDTQLSDLHDKITQQQAIVTASQSIEARDRNLQDRLAVVAKITTQATDQVQTVLTTIDQAKGDVTFKSISQTDNEIKIDVLATNSVGLNNFIENLRNNLKASDISIDSLQTLAQTQQLEANITIMLLTSTLP